MENPRIIGHVVSVNGFRIKVELLQNARSASRATLEGVQTAIAINAYVTFSIGAGISMIGMITDLEAREAYDPLAENDSLELIKARRIAIIQLMGTVELKGKDWEFNPSITILPTLDNIVEIARPEMLKAIFENPPQRNKPDNVTQDYDYDLTLGTPTGEKHNKVKASYNDLFSRPLAIVGNTGSGKSYSVANLLQKAISGDVLKNEKKNAPHIFILDINGEYSNAFNIPEYKKQPDHIYLNGKEFGIPLWFFNAQEICAWLSASEQTQEPVLKDWWAVVKSNTNDFTENNSLIHAITHIEECLTSLHKGKSENIKSRITTVKSYVDNSFQQDIDQINELLKNAPEWLPLSNEPRVRQSLEQLCQKIQNSVPSDQISSTSDTPLLITKKNLSNPRLLNRSVSQEDKNKIDSHLTTLKLRLKTKIDDRRWKSFLNYEDDNTKFNSLREWLNRFYFVEKDSSRISVLDLSMLSHEVLPYACGVLGRIFLEIRERLPADKRYKHPWVLVLEEAHNYARPTRNNEEKGQILSRESFERIAKEGRKFGLSLIVASQRPSEISPTIISQCANFISHRLQNPDDIDHFKRIIPIQARRMLDQVTVLASGEAIVFGSAFHIPARVQMDKPTPEPHSQTSAPYHEWGTDKTHFPIDEIIKNWNIETVDTNKNSVNNTEVYDNQNSSMETEDA